MRLILIRILRDYACGSPSIVTKVNYNYIGQDQPQELGRIGVSLCLTDINLSCKTLCTLGTFPVSFRKFSNSQKRCRNKAVNIHVPSTWFCGFPYVAMLSIHFFLNHLKVDIMTSNPRHFSLSLKNWNICHPTPAYCPTEEK